MNDTTKNDSSSIAKVNYILQIISTIIGITGIIAVIIAYVNRDDSDDWLQTHYRFQIRTFWISVIYITLGVLLLQVMVGLFILAFTFFWLVIRCAKGLKQLSNNEPVKNVESWFFA